jgi:hypothetical protein
MLRCDGWFGERLADLNTVLGARRPDTFIDGTGVVTRLSTDVGARYALARRCGSKAVILISLF